MIRRIFLTHPETVDETYLQHMAFALKFAGKLLFAGIAALIHAFVPCLCEKTASKAISDLHTRMHNRS